MNKECGIYKENFHLNLGKNRGLSSPKSHKNSALAARNRHQSAYDHAPGACERGFRYF